jgi:hypothetical protein
MARNDARRRDAYYLYRGSAFKKVGGAVSPPDATIRGVFRGES